MRATRRSLLRALAAAPLAAAPAALRAHPDCPDAGTPLQFAPHHGPDPEPLAEEPAKYPRCPYCGMDRRQWHHSRHLVHYGDDRVDPTCSLHCAAIGLALNIDRAPRAVYAADYGGAAEPRPLVAVDPGPAWYLVGSELPGTMTRRSKMAFAREAEARAAQAAHGGEVTGFDGALTAAYLDMAADTRMVRRKRAERRRRAAEAGE